MNELPIVAPSGLPAARRRTRLLNFAMFRSALARGETRRPARPAHLARPARLPLPLVPDPNPLQVQRQVPATLGTPLRRLPPHRRPAPHRPGRHAGRRLRTYARRPPPQAPQLRTACASPHRPANTAPRLTPPLPAPPHTPPTRGAPAAHGLEGWGHEYAACTGHSPRPPGMGLLCGHGRLNVTDSLLSDGGRWFDSTRHQHGLELVAQRRAHRRRRRVHPPRRHPSGRRRRSYAGSSRRTGPGRRRRHLSVDTHARASPAKPSTRAPRTRQRRQRRASRPRHDPHRAPPAPPSSSCTGAASATT